MVDFMKNIRTLMVATSLLFPTISCAGKLDGISVDLSDYTSKTAYRKAMRERRQIERRQELGAANRVAAVELIGSGMQEVGYEPAEGIELDFTSMEAYSKSIIGKFPVGKGVVLLPHYLGVMQMVLPLKDLDSAIAATSPSLTAMLSATGSSTVQGSEIESPFVKLVSQDLMQGSFFSLADLTATKAQWLKRMEPIWREQQAQYDKASAAIDEAGASLGQPVLRGNAGMMIGPGILEPGKLGNALGLMMMSQDLPPNPASQIAAQREAIETMLFIPLDEIPSITGTNGSMRFFDPRH
jgi:hypothetical protein